MKPNIDYLPIDCGFHDRLEDLATRGVVAEIRLNNNSTVGRAGVAAGTIVRATILDVFSKSGADWAVIGTEKGECTVRLDEIVSINGIVRPVSDANCTTEPGDLQS